MDFPVWVNEAFAWLCLAGVVYFLFRAANHLHEVDPVVQQMRADNIAKRNRK